jgi:N-acetylmuramoyl-L-alanine amidase
MQKKYNIKAVLVLIGFVLLLVSSKQAAAASSLALYNTKTKQNINYTGKQVNYYLDGKKINLNNAAGLIIDGYALAPYDEVFVKSGFDLNYSYDKTKGKVALFDEKTKLIFTIGSKKATLNGKSVTLPIAPMQIKYKAANITKILVPTRYVAEAFGYTYVWKSAESSVYITGPLKLYYNGKKVNYTSTLGNVTVNGKSIDVKAMPSIIISNTAMVQGKKVFNSSYIGATYLYNKTDKTVTFTKGNTEVKLTLGSPIAYVNGSPRIMDTSPLVVKNLNTNKSYIMVPGSFVSSYLGYDYSWNSSTKTSVITTRTEEDNDDDVIVDGPELGGDDNLPEVTLFSWALKDMYSFDYEQVKNKINTTEIASDIDTASNIYAVAKDYSYSTTKETYLVYSSTPIGKLTAGISGDSLNISVANSMTNTTSYLLGGSIVDTISTSYQSDNNSSSLSFHLLSPDVKYELTLSDDKNILYVTVYKNYLSNITVGKKGNYEYVQLTGMNPLSVEVSQANNLLVLTIPNTINGVGDNYADTSTLAAFKTVQVLTMDQNSIQLILNLSDSQQYNVTNVNNIYTISFGNQDTVSTTSTMQIPLPAGVTYSQVRHEDLYYNKQFSIILQGDYRTFYSQNPITKTSSVIRNIEVIYKNNETYINVSTTKLQGYKLANKSGTISVTIGDPRDIYKNIVVLDAGHGGTDPGAMRTYNGKTINEKDINFAIIQKAVKYFNSADSDIKVYLSRYNDTKVDLYERAAFSEVVGADLFISLHMNANYDTSIDGTEIYYTESNNSISEMGINSKGLASLFLNSLPNMVGTDTRSIRAQNYVVTRENTVPAILIELGFMSNVGDLSLMVDSTFQEETAKAIYNILNIVFDSYPTGR